MTSASTPIRGLVFDVDGTLADSMEHYYRVACDIVERAGAPAVSRRRVLDLMGRGEPDLVKRLLPPDLPGVDATVARIAKERLQHWRRAAHDLQPVAGVPALLRHLHDQGLVLGIATSANRALPFLDGWGVRDLFAAIVGREDVERRKPDPEGLLRCLDELGIDEEAAAYVGDSPIDMQASRKAGTMAIGVLTGTSDAHTLDSAGAHHVLPSAAHIPDLLGLPPIP
jgi:HAD superfamily hydrolase (TIGR01509 family)